MDDQIAEHAFEQGHWPGLTVEQIATKIFEVRSEFQNAHDFGNGRCIFRKGDAILIDDGQGGGTFFRPYRSALQYFEEFVNDELGQDSP